MVLNYIDLPTLQNCCNFAGIIGGSIVATIWLDKMSGAPELTSFRSFFMSIGFICNGK